MTSSFDFLKTKSTLKRVERAYSNKKEFALNRECSQWQMSPDVWYNTRFFHWCFVRMKTKKKAKKKERLTNHCLCLAKQWFRGMDFFSIHITDSFLAYLSIITIVSWYFFIDFKRSTSSDKQWSWRPPSWSWRYSLSRDDVSLTKSYVTSYTTNALVHQRAVVVIFPLLILPLGRIGKPVKTSDFFIYYARKCYQFAYTRTLTRIHQQEKISK